MNILITGASKGIGREMALRFVKEYDYNVLAVSRSIDGLKTLAEAVEGDKIKFIRGDITKLVEDPTKLLDRVNKKIGVIDILINNAGFLIPGKFNKISNKDDFKMIDTNFIAPMRLIKALLPLISTKGHVINISSMSGYQGSAKYPGLAIYGAAKAALASLSESLAKEYDSTGPSFNSLSLGAVQTEMLSEAFPGYKAPLQPDEMAEFICWFAVNGSKFFNGKNIPVAVSNP